MINRKTESILLILIGLIITGCGLYIYFVAHTIYPRSESSRVQDLNWLLKTFGKTGTAILFGLTGLIPVWVGIKKIIKKKTG
jgi:uncharacterized membrane-anchored protein YitT (DUF2179 family)